MKNKERISLIFRLFLTFFKIGAFTFGGGYAMIPLIVRETAEKKGWIKEEDILDIIAIAESTPGPLAINTATFVGYKTAGFFGAFAATTGVVLPSFLIIFTVSYVLRQFESLKAVKYAFFGIRAGVAALIVKALWNMYKKCPKGAISYIVIGLAFIFAAFTKINIVWIIVGCGVIGFVSSVIMGRRRGK